MYRLISLLVGLYFGANEVVLGENSGYSKLAYEGNRPLQFAAADARGVERCYLLDPCPQPA